MRKADKCFPFDEKDEKPTKNLGRCEICNYTNDDKAGCAEPLADIRPESSSVHFYPELGQELCQYCHTIVQKNKKFYKFHFTDGESVRFNEPRYKQENQKTTLKLPQMSEQ